MTMTLKIRRPKYTYTGPSSVMIDTCRKFDKSPHEKLRNICTWSIKKGKQFRSVKLAGLNNEELTSLMDMHLAKKENSLFELLMHEVEYRMENDKTNI